MALISEKDSDRGDRIADLMARRGWTDISLSEEIGCERQTVWRWRAGLPISGRYFGKLVEALGTTREYLVSGPASEVEERREAEAKAQADALRAESIGDDELGLGEASGS